MKKSRSLKAITAVVLVGTLMTGTLTGCSLFEEKKKRSTKADDSDVELVWPFSATEDTDAENDESKDSWFDFSGDQEPSGATVDVPVTEETEPVSEETEPVTETTAPLTEPTEPETEPTTTAPTEYFPDTIIHPITGGGEITASVLNIREYPGMDYEVLGGLERGTRVVIYDQVMVDGEYWGEIYQGWVNMQWVAMDGDVVGTWYQSLGYDGTTGEDLYGFWTLELTGEFRYVVYGFGMDQIRQISRSGGTFRMDDYRISFDFSYGSDAVTLAGITAEVPGNVTCYWNVVGKTMTLKEAGKTELIRGTVEKLREQLQEED